MNLNNLTKGKIYRSYNGEIVMYLKKTKILIVSDKYVVDYIFHSISFGETYAADDIEISLMKEY